MRMNLKNAIVLSTLAVFCLSVSGIAGAAAKRVPVAPKPQPVAQQASPTTSAAKTSVPTTAARGGGGVVSTHKR